MIYISRPFLFALNMVVTKKRFNCFRKQFHIGICTSAFRELERFEFEFGDFSFAGNHVHLRFTPSAYVDTVIDLQP